MASYTPHHIAGQYQGMQLAAVGPSGTDAAIVPFCSPDFSRGSSILRTTRSENTIRVLLDFLESEGAQRRRFGFGASAASRCHFAIGDASLVVIGFGKFKASFLEVGVIASIVGAS